MPFDRWHPRFSTQRVWKCSRSFQRVSWKKFPKGVLKVVFSASCRSILIWLYPLKPSIKEKVWWPEVACQWVCQRLAKEIHLLGMHCSSLENRHRFWFGHSFLYHDNIGQPCGVFDRPDESYLKELFNFAFDLEIKFMAKYIGKSDSLRSGRNYAV